MELDTRHYGRYQLDEEAIEKWRRHSCLSKLSLAQREASYAAAIPLLQGAANHLVNLHSWHQVAAAPLTADGSDNNDNNDAHVLFCIQAPASDTMFTLPTSYRAFFDHARSCERMFEALFDICLDPQDGRLGVAEPLTDIFHLLQLLIPGCLMLVKAEYATHEVDDEGEVAWISWRTYVRALPPASWMDLHANQLMNIFGDVRWAALRRAAVNSEVMVAGDITFS